MATEQSTQNTIPSFSGCKKHITGCKDDLKGIFREDDDELEDEKEDENDDEEEEDENVSSRSANPIT